MIRYCDCHYSNHRAHTIFSHTSWFSSHYVWSWAPTTHSASASAPLSLRYSQLRSLCHISEVYWVPLVGFIIFELTLAVAGANELVDCLSIHLTSSLREPEFGIWHQLQSWMVCASSREAQSPTFDCGGGKMARRSVSAPMPLSLWSLLHKKSSHSEVKWVFEATPPSSFSTSGPYSMCLWDRAASDAVDSSGSLGCWVKLKMVQRQAHWDYTMS